MMFFRFRYDYALSSYTTLPSTDWSLNPSITTSQAGNITHNTSALLPAYPSSIPGDSSNNPMNNSTNNTPTPSGSSAASLNLVNSYMKAPISPLGGVDHHGSHGEDMTPPPPSGGGIDYGYQYGLGSSNEHGEYPPNLKNKRIM